MRQGICQGICLNRLCLAIVLLVSFGTSIGGCTNNAQTVERTQPNYTKILPRSSTGSRENLSASLDEAEVAAAQSGRASHVEVTCSLPVKRMLRPDEKGEKHEKFLLQLSNGTTVLVAHNVSRAPSVPVEAGDIVTVHGEYIWNEKGGVIHWTHASDTPRHESGYIDFNGQRYQ